MTSYLMPHSARRPGGLLVAAVLTAGLVTWAPVPAAAAGGFQTEELRVESGSGADQVELDVTLFVPASATEAEPAASIVIAHGYGGTKEQSRGQATKFARDGYVVLTYTARGFGDSTGDISLNAPDYEVADARTLIDLLSERPEVLQDSEGDPRVGFFGGSYGGGLSLLAAGYDERIDAVSAARTWNSLVNSLFPNAAGMPAADTPAAPGAAEAADGVFKKLWAQFFFEGGSLDPEGGGRGDGSGGGGQRSGGCEDLRPEYCAAYEEVISTNRLTEEMRELLAQASPASVTDQITAPTLLIQGEGDTLFSLTEADSNAREIAANGTPVKLVWVTGGHGATRATLAEAAMIDELGQQWFDFYLRDSGEDPGTSFEYTEVSEQAANGPIEGTPETVPAYPGLTGNGPVRLEVPIAGEAQELQYPAGGTPAALSSLPPGFFPESGDRRQEPTEIADQSAVFESEPLAEALDVVGSPVVNLNVASSSGEAVLFTKVYDVAPDGSATLVQGLVAPARLTDLPATLDQAESTPITLPALAHSFQEGHQLRVVVSSTDQAYATPAEAATYQVSLASGVTGALSIPDVTGQPAPEFTAPQPRGQRIHNIALIVGGVVVGLAVLAAVYLLLRRRRAETPPW